ncbi:hypothetical protein [Cerasicoccus fimbriatus]|uniref:hypothetical protein n=1 Tax=Cerasicoccus fimbriatus TaxID=3014554 RepID=UPI0022B41D37|nr:hypothetical protein [Cerasicoccus sp. TK19100]
MNHLNGKILAYLAIAFIQFLFQPLHAGSMDDWVTGTIDLTGADSTEKFYPVYFELEKHATNDEPLHSITIFRSNVHEDSLWAGSLIAHFKFHPNRYGHGPTFAESFIISHRNQFVGDFAATNRLANHTADRDGAGIVVWLRGGYTYLYRTPTVVINDYTISNSAEFLELRHEYNSQTQSIIKGESFGVIDEISPEITNNGYTGPRSEYLVDSLFTVYDEQGNIVSEEVSNVPQVYGTETVVDSIRLRKPSGDISMGVFGE